MHFPLAATNTADNPAAQDRSHPPGLVSSLSLANDYPRRKGPTRHAFSIATISSAKSDDEARSHPWRIRGHEGSVLLGFVDRVGLAVAEDAEVTFGGMIDARLKIGSKTRTCS